MKVDSQITATQATARATFVVLFWGSPRYYSELPKKRLHEGRWNVTGTIF